MGLKDIRVMLVDEETGQRATDEVGFYLYGGGPISKAKRKELIRQAKNIIYNLEILGKGDS